MGSRTLLCLCLLVLYFSNLSAAAKDTAATLTAKWKIMINQEQKKSEEGACPQPLFFPFIRDHFIDWLTFCDVC